MVSNKRLVVSYLLYLPHDLSPRFVKGIDTSVTRPVGSHAYGRACDHVRYSILFTNEKRLPKYLSSGGKS